MYYGARFYDPALGTFLSPDSVVPDPSRGDALNRYQYTGGNPLKYTDPTGHQGVVPGIPDPDEWTARTFFGVPDSRKLPPETGLQGLTGDLGKTVTQAIGKVNEVVAPAVEFLLGLFPGYDVVTAAVGTNIGGQKLSPEQRVFSGALGIMPFGELGDAASISVKFGKKTLQHEFARHAPDFGVVGHANKQTLAEFEAAIMRHIAGSDTQIVQGTYRGAQKVTHFFDPVTRLWAAVDENGTFVAGWRLSEKQVEYLQTIGNVQ